MPGATVVADAETDAQIDGDVVAFGELGNRFADLNCHARRLMAADELARVAPRDHRFAVVEAEVAAADAGRLDFGQNLVGTDAGHRHGANFDLLVARQENGGHRGHWLSLSLRGALDCAGGKAAHERAPHGEE